MSRIKIPRSLYWQTRLFMATRGFWQHLGNLETRILQDDIERIEIESPIYICGLARAGTTVVTELLNQHSELTSHRYSDFPFTFIPYWKNWFRQRSRIYQAKPQQRAHADRIVVTQDSPEAIEEVIWMHFFKHLHVSEGSEILDETCDNVEFEVFYRQHIQKLLLARTAKRYLAKANYNVSRVRYILKQFPGARFVFMIRNPVDHIASLQKQHQLFSADSDPRIARQLAASGHFEFGDNRKAINFDDQVQQDIVRAWINAEDIKGWALYWDSVYRYLAELMNDSAIASNCLLVRYEDLCTDSEHWIQKILDHCQLDVEPDVLKYADELSLPDYYKIEFSTDEWRSIEQHCQQTAMRNSYTISHERLAR